MKKVLFYAIGCIAVLGGVIGIFILSLQQNMKTIQALPIGELQLEQTPDGIYQGEYYYEDQIGATVLVTVLNGEITEIEIEEHICGKGVIAESITEDIISAQSLDVDSIAGATTSSHVLKLAIKDALEEIE